MKEFFSLKNINNIFKKLVLTTMCLFVVAEYMPVYAKETKVSEASLEGSIELYDAIIDYKQNTVDNGDGSFTYEIKLSSKLNINDINTESLTATNNYYEVKKAGTYLIEMWGGNGADGDSTRFANGGKGGKGGYLYGKINLDVGDILYYTIGGNGTKTLVVDGGGGANGDGGGHGDIGSYNVGGGGGYTAVYLFKNGEFDSYLDDDLHMKQTSINESDRKTKYVMIAAGGGGGGAGDGFSIVKPIGTADGGNGGSINGQNDVLGPDYRVPGTVFVGNNGSSSGKSFDYIGYGGTTLPGYIPDTHINLFKGKMPNNWDATANPKFAGGSGGSGNFRGGAGGAGFCGGSGGTMTTLLIPTNVGGGGGGSSFISNKFSLELNENEKANLKHENASETGGSINVTYLEDNNGSSNLGTFNLSGTISKYFDITNLDDIEYNNSTGLFEKQNISLERDGSETVISLNLRPKQGFAGGNNVPIFNDFSIALSSNAASSSLAVNKEIGYVNVPLNLNLNGKTLISNAPGNGFNPNELYEDTYASVRNELTSHWEYDFIENIGDIQVEGEKIDGQFKPEITTDYPLSMAVNLKDGSAVLGKINSNPFVVKGNSKIVVGVNTDNTLDEGNVSVNYNKTLKYENGQYVLSLEVNEKTSSIVLTNSFTNTYDFEDEVSNSSYHECTIPADGYYMIQAWGGNGGPGANAFSSKGGIAGKGGYTIGYQFFNKNDKLDIFVGSAGEPSFSTSDRSKGGVETRVKLNNDNLLVAGGGGGGGNAISIIIYGIDGQPGDSVDNNNLISKKEALNNQNGKEGHLNNISENGEGGSAGSNYNGMIREPGPELTEESEEKFNNAMSSTSRDTPNGRTIVTCLQTKFTEDRGKYINTQRLSNQKLDLGISKYFEIKDIVYEGCSATQENGFESSITNICPNVDNINHTLESNVLNSEAKYKINIVLEPKEGFLGGNDVPLLENMILSQPQQGIIYNGENIGNVTNGSITIMPIDSTDYANVALNYNFDLNAIDKTYVIGDSGIPKSSLYSWDNKLDFANMNADYVMGGEKFTDEILTPDVTTDYPLEFSVSPKTDSSKAIVVNPATPINYKITPTIYVKCNIIEDYNHISSNLKKDVNDSQGRILANVNEELKFKLKPEQGYKLPKEIEVKSGEESITSYTYDSKSGEVTIHATALNNTIEIIAESEPLKYSLKYIFEDEPGKGQMKKTENYTAGEKIPKTAFGYTYSGKNFKGYHFEWDWATEDNMPLKNMPSNDYYVIGKYIPNEYDLTIKYYVDGKLSSTINKKIAYGAEYNVPTPIKPGYVADITNVVGTMPPENKIEEVHYTNTQNKLIVVYIKNDTKQEFKRYEEDVNLGDIFEQIVSPSIDGYNPDKEVIPSGQMVEGGIIEYVYYEPNQIDISFNSGNDEDVIPKRTVIYNNYYGYDAETKKYEALPVPSRPGSRFVGWFLDNEQIYEDTIVQNANSHELMAKWDVNDYALTVDFSFEDGTSAGKSITKYIKCGENYDFAIPEIKGYESTINGIPKENVSGIGIAEDQTIKVVYKTKKYILTINYLNNKDEPIFEAGEYELNYGEHYSYKSPIRDGYECSTPVVEGDMPYQSKVVNVYYYKKMPKISFEIAWGDLTFDYTNGEWDPMTHSYKEDTLEPHTMGENKISIKNTSKSNIEIDADLSYNPNPKYKSLNGYFTSINNANASNIFEIPSILKGNTGVAYFWLNGSLDLKQTETIESGKIIINVRGGAKDGKNLSAE